MAIFKPKTPKLTDEQKEALIEKSNEIMKNYKEAPEPKPIKSVVEKEKKLVTRPKPKPKPIPQLIPRPIHSVKLEPPKLVTQDLRGRQSTEYRGREERV